MFYTRRHPLMFALSMPFLSPDPDPGAGGNPPADPPEDKVTFDPKQQAELNRLLAEERRKSEQKIKDQTAKERAQEEADRQRQADEAKGEYEKAKTALEQAKSAAETERDALKAENESYVTVLTAQYEAEVTEIPEAIWKVLKPADDAPLSEKMTQLHKAKELAKEVGAGKPAGNPPNPKPAGGGALDVEKEAAKLRARPGFRL